MLNVVRETITVKNVSNSSSQPVPPKENWSNGASLIVIKLAKIQLPFIKLRKKFSLEKEKNPQNWQ